MDTIKIESGNTKMVAHRGLSGIELQNTCPAFLAAANRSYFGIETDVHVTKDKQFVVIHNETTEAVTRGEYNINVETSNYSEIENIVLPDTDGTTVRKDIRIPRLEEYIQICKKYGKICVLELKNHFEKADLMLLLEHIREAEYLDGIIFISFDLENCINIRKELPDAPVQYLIHTETFTEEMHNILLENDLDLDIYYKALTADIVAQLHSEGKKVNCWTCNDKEQGEALVRMGVDYITSNILE